jgi:polyphenol oxidase
MSAQIRFTTRRGGVSVGPYAELNLGSHVGDDDERVTENRRRLAAELGVDRIVFMHQVHGRDVAVVDDPNVDDVADVDALVSASPGVALAVLVADCVPVVIAGSRGVAVVHAGRRGVYGDVVTAAVDQLRSLDSGPLNAHIGPAICGRCYEVQADMQADVVAAVPEARSVTRRETASLDLKAGVAAQLRRAGITDIVVDPACTAEDERYFSHRRDGLTGRFAGVAVVTGDRASTRDPTR